MSSVELIQAGAGAISLLHPLRSSLLEALRQPDSAAGLARRLSMPRQKINYHLRDLEREGLVELVEERRKGNCVERVMRRTARAFVISPQAVGALDLAPDEIADRFSSSYLVAVAAQAIRDIGRLRPRARQAGRKLATFTLQTRIGFSSAAARRRFLEELNAQLARLIETYHDESAASSRRFHLFLGAYPALPEEERKP